MRRARNNEIVAQVRCQGGIHRIRLNRKGRLILQSHRDLLRERVVEELSGEKCRCREVLALWRDIIAGKVKEHIHPGSKVLRELPHALRAPAYDAAMKRQERTQARAMVSAEYSFRLPTHGKVGSFHSSECAAIALLDMPPWGERVINTCSEAALRIHEKISYQMGTGHRHHVVTMWLDPDRSGTSPLPVLTIGIDLRNGFKKVPIETWSCKPLYFALGYLLTGGTVYDPDMKDDMLCLGFAPGYREDYKPGRSVDVVVARLLLARDGEYFLQAWTARAEKVGGKWTANEWGRPFLGYWGPE
jgi:hypothetical protein